MSLRSLTPAAPRASRVPSGARRTPPFVRCATLFFLSEKFTKIFSRAVILLLLLQSGIHPNPGPRQPRNGPPEDSEATHPSDQSATAAVDHHLDVSVLRSCVEAMLRATSYSPTIAGPPTPAILEFHRRLRGPYDRPHFFFLLLFSVLVSTLTMAAHGYSEALAVLIALTSIMRCVADSTLTATRSIGFMAAYGHDPRKPTPVCQPGLLHRHRIRDLAIIMAFVLFIAGLAPTTRTLIYVTRASTYIHAPPLRAAQLSRGNAEPPRRRSRRHSRAVIFFLLAIGGVHPNPGPPHHHSLAESVKSHSWSQARPPPRLRQDTAISFLEQLDLDWRSCPLTWDKAKKKKLLRQTTTRDRSANGFYARCSNITVIDLDGDTGAARDVLRLCGDDCNLVATTKKGAHLFFSFCPRLATHISRDGSAVDIRTGGPGREPDIILVHPSEYTSDDGRETYNWVAVPDAGKSLLQVPDGLVHFLQGLPGYNPRGVAPPAAVVTPVLAGPPRVPPPDAPSSGPIRSAVAATDTATSLRHHSQGAGAKPSVPECVPDPTHAHSRSHSHSELRVLVGTRLSSRGLPDSHIITDMLCELDSPSLMGLLEDESQLLDAIAEATKVLDNRRRPHHPDPHNTVPAVPATTAVTAPDPPAEPEVHEAAAAPTAIPPPCSEGTAATQHDSDSEHEDATVDGTGAPACQCAICGVSIPLYTGSNKRQRFRSHLQDHLDRGLSPEAVVRLLVGNEALCGCGQIMTLRKNGSRKQAHAGHSPPGGGVPLTPTTATFGAEGPQDPGLAAAPIPASVPASSHGQQPGRILLPSLSDISRAGIATVTHIDPGSRPPFAQRLATLLSDACLHNDVYSWSLVHMYPICILDARGSSKKKGPSQKELKARMELWDAGGADQLWKASKDRLRHSGKGLSNKVRRREDTSGPDIARAITMARNGRYSKSLQALQSRGMPTKSKELIDKVQSLHPRRDVPVSIPPSEAPAPVLSSKDVHAAANSFFPGTAPGPSGFRAEHLKDLLRADTSDQLLTALTKTVNLLASGRACAALKPTMGGARLIAINKKDGGLRPIAIGETLRRLTAKCLISKLSSVVPSAVGKNQYGVGSPGGASRVAHLARRAVNSRSSDDFVLFKVDKKNAFNTVDRSAVLASVSAKIPGLLPWARWCYGESTTLFFDGELIQSAQGVQQGDPLGPLLYSLAVADMIEELNSLGLVGNWWYLDDGVLAGDSSTVRRALDVLRRRAPSLGLQLNLSKCELVHFGPSPPLHFADVACKRLHQDFDVLGTPVGSDQFVAEYVRKKVISKLQDTAANICLLDDPQIAYTILRACAAFSPLVHIMRTVPPHQLRNTASELDEVIFRSFAQIIGRALLPKSVSQAALGVGQGGLGLRRTQDHLAAAFLGGCHQAALADGWSLSEDPAYASAAKAFSASFKNVHLSTSHTQKELSSFVDTASAAALLSQSSSRLEQGRLRSVSSSEAGIFWNVTPSEALHLSLPPAHFRVIVLWWLGEPIYLEDHPCPKCRVACCDRQGYHSLVCRHGGNLGIRHNALRDVLFRFAQRSAMGPRVEQRVIPGSARRNADILLPSTGHGIVCDVAVTHPLQPAYLPATASGGEPAADTYARTHKSSKFGADVEAEGYEYAPCVVDAFGNWGSSGRAVLTSIAVAASARDNIPRGVHLRRLLSCCSVSLMLSNARALLQREDPATYLDDAPMADTERGFDGDESPAVPHLHVAGGLSETEAAH